MENPNYSEGYIVKTSSTEESSFVVRYLKGLPDDTPDFGNKFKYVIYSPLAPNNNFFDFIPQDMKHYPILTFEEFKEKILNKKKQW